MKVSLLKLRIQTCYFCGGLLALAVNFFLASASLAQADETRIAFYSNRSDGRNSEIYLMNSDGKRVRRLTRHPQYDGVPAWSPNGQKITFISDRDQHDWEIYVMNPDDANPINLTQSPGRRDRASSWSPDGQQIVFYSNRDGNREVYVMNADGTNPINLTNHLADDRHPDWSPDGRRIAFTSNRDGDWEKEPNDNWEVFVMDADGANPINLTNHKAWDTGPAWGPAPTLSVTSKGKLATLWGNVKHTSTYRVR